MSHSIRHAHSISANASMADAPLQPREKDEQPMSILTTKLQSQGFRKRPW